MKPEAHELLRLMKAFDQVPPGEHPPLPPAEWRDLPWACEQWTQWLRQQESLREQRLPASDSAAMAREVLKSIQPSVEGTPTWWKAPVWAGIAASLMLGVWWGFRDGSLPPAPVASAAAVEYVESGIVGASPVVYVDEESGAAVIWLLEPLMEDSDDG